MLFVWAAEPKMSRKASLASINFCQSALHNRVGSGGHDRLDWGLQVGTVSMQDTPCYLLVLMAITERERSELELVEAIETVMQDTSWFSQTLIEKLANPKPINTGLLPDASFTDLTRRERRLLTH